MPDDATNFVVVFRTGQLVHFDGAVNALVEAEIPHRTSEESAGGLVVAPVFPSAGPATWWSVAVPEHLVEQARQVLSALPAEITTQPDVWDFRPKRGVKPGWQVVIVLGLLAPLILVTLCFLVILGRGVLLGRGRPGTKPDATYWAKAGYDHRRLGNHQAAADCFSEAIRLSPHWIGGYLERGICRDELRDYTNAILDFGVVLSAEPTNFYALANLAQARSAIGQYDAALDSYNRASSLDSNNAAVFLGRGQVFQKKRRFEAAIFDFNRCLAINPREARALHSRAFCQVQTQKLEEALESYTQSLAVDPENASAYDGRGYAYQQLGRWEAAANDYERSLQIDPSFGSAHFGQAECFHHYGMYFDAWRAVHRAQKCNTVVSQSFLDQLKAAMPEPLREPVETQKPRAATRR